MRVTKVLAVGVEPEDLICLRRVLMESKEEV